TMRTLRSLFPRPARRRLRFRAGWFALPYYVLLVLFYPLSLQQAEWVRAADHFTWLAILGVITGVLVGNTRMSTTRAILLGGVLGAIAIVIATSMATEGNAILREKLVKLAISVNNWLTQVLAGESASDPTAFILFIMAFFTPRVGAAEVLGRAYNVFESPYHSVEAEWQRFFAGVSGPSKMRGVSFTESFRLGQSPNLSDRVVMTVDAASGHFW